MLSLTRTAAGMAPLTRAGGGGRGGCLNAGRDLPSTESASQSGAPNAGSPAYPHSIAYPSFHDLFRSFLFSAQLLTFASSGGPSPLVCPQTWLVSRPRSTDDCALESVGPRPPCPHPPWARPPTISRVGTPRFSVAEFSLGGAGHGHALRYQRSSVAEPRRVGTPCLVIGQGGFSPMGTC